MPTRDRPGDIGARNAARLLRSAADELRQARLGAGLSQAAVGRAAGLSHSAVSRIERGAVPNASVVELARVAAVVGLQLSVRAFPGGDALRDGAHVRLLARLRRHVAASLTWRTEVPLPIEGDRRAWDAVIGGPGFRIGVEAETKVVDAQAVARKVNLKRRDGGVDHVVLVLSDTTNNRSNAPLVASGLDATEPLEPRVLLEALRRGVDPGGSGVVIL